MSILAQLAIALVLLVVGFGGGVRWHAGQDAIAAQEAQQLRLADERQQRRFSDREAGQHAAHLESLNRKLVTAHDRIAKLSGRSCLDPGTVGVLNDTGLQERGAAAAGEPADPRAAAAAAAGDRDASDVDVAGYIALCRTEYAKVADRLNRILDIEDRRHPPVATPP